jgi:hypothetical protein
MSYAVPVQPGRSRPTVVTVAVYLMWAALVLNLINVGLTFVPTPELDRALDEFNRDHPELSSGGSVEAIGTYIGVGLTLLVAAGFGVLTVFVGRGNQPARVTTWVLAGIFVLCQGCGLISSAALPALLNGMAGSGNADTEAVAEQTRILTENTPAWLTATTTATAVLILLALIAVIILLAVPSANEFFRKQEQVWVPPTGPGGGFPQYPLATPQYPAGPQFPPTPPQYPATPPPQYPQAPGVPPVPPAPPGQPPYPPSQPPTQA